MSSLTEQLTNQTQIKPILIELVFCILSLTASVVLNGKKTYHNGRSIKHRSFPTNTLILSTDKEGKTGN